MHLLDVLQPRLCAFDAHAAACKDMRIQKKKKKGGCHNSSLGQFNGYKKVTCCYDDLCQMSLSEVKRSLVFDAG